MRTPVRVSVVRRGAFSRLAHQCVCGVRVTTAPPNRKVGADCNGLNNLYVDTALGDRIIGGCDIGQVTVLVWYNEVMHIG